MKDLSIFRRSFRLSRRGWMLLINQLTNFNQETSGCGLLKTRWWTFGFWRQGVPLHAMEALWWERRYSSYSFSTSALDGGEWSVLRPGRALAPGKRIPGTYCIGGWVGPRAGLDTQVTGKILSLLPGIELRSPGRPARSETLYWLSYPDHS
jgi:hypothetical protein